MPAPELKLQTNVPEIIALKFEDGKEFPSNYEGSAPRVMFTLVDGRVIYLPKPFAESIKNNGIGANTPFEICKREVANGKTQLQFRGVRTAGPDSFGNKKTAPAVAPANAAPLSQPALQQPSQDKQHSNGTAPARYSEVPALPPLPSNPVTPIGAKLLAAYMLSVDTLLETQVYATRKGLALAITTEDIRCLAATIFIEQNKQGGR